MSAANRSLLLRYARWQARTLVKVWPRETRRWGQAMASEAYEIDRPWEALWWTLGGATVYLRALGSRVLAWLKMSVGERGAGREPLLGGTGPKRSRLFTAVVLAMAVVLLCLPEGREAVRTVTETWKSYAEIDTSQAELEKLAAQAEKQNDAHPMAFAALGLEDGKRATELADRAVQLEPRLSWVYSARRYWPDDNRTPQDWVRRAQAADPQNAVPYLMAADVIAQQVYSGLAKQHTPTENEEIQALLGHAEWVMWMDKGFHAPVYNSYYREHEQLNREVWRRNPQLSLATVLQTLWRHAIPNLMSLHCFTTRLIQQAQEERTAGRNEKARELLSVAEGFSKRMQEDSGNARFGGFGGWGLRLERETALGWQAYYEGTAQPQKAQEAAQVALQIEQSSAEEVRELQRRWVRQQQSRHEQGAWVVQLSALSMLAAGLAALVAIGLFEIWPAMRRRSTPTCRALSGLVDFAPSVALAASAAFLLSFLPYARAMAEFREGAAGTGDAMRQLSMTFWGLHDVATSLAGSNAAVLGWTVLTVMLCLTAALLLARMIYRARRTPATQV